MVDPAVLLLCLAIALGYYTVEAMKAPIDKTAHVVKVVGRKACHVVTFGKKCAEPEADDATPQP